MARPLKDGLSYFQHDVDMSADEKLEALEAVHGNDGYAVFNKLLERVYKSNGKLDLSNDVQRLSIAKRCNVTAEKFDQIITDAIRFGLFDKEPWEAEKRLSSDRIRKQLETVEAEREREREKWQKREKGENPIKEEFSPGKTPVLPGENPSSTQVEVHKAEQSRGEYIKQQPRASDMSPEEALAFKAWALERAKKAKARNPTAYARTILDDPEAYAEYLAEQAPKPFDGVKLYPEPPLCDCGHAIKANLIRGDGVCPGCGAGWTYIDDDWGGWTKDAPPAKPVDMSFEKHLTNVAGP